MSTRLTPQAFRNIHALGLLHILKGGGVVPDDGSTDIEDVIGSIAVDHFGAKAAIDEFDAALAGADLDTNDRISSAVWGVVGVHEYAAFTLGAAVAMQLRGLSTRRRSRTQVAKGGR